MARGPLRRRQPNQNRPIPRVANRTAATNAARAELERKLASKPIGQRPTDSDDSDRLVVKGNGRRGRNVSKQEIYATGAVGAGDKPGAYPSRAQRRRSLSNDTKEVLARRRSEGRRDEGSQLNASDSQRQHKSLANESVNKSIDMPQATAQPATTTISSAIKAPGSILRATQPTPTRETSLLGTLKPRRRQPSILQQIDHDSSSFDLDAEEEFLPDAVSTPLNLSNTRPMISSPATVSTQHSTSRKRKLGQSDPLQPPEDLGQPISRSPLATMLPRRLTPEPSLPTIPLSTLRESGRKQRKTIADGDDVMAPPQSSSSPRPSLEEASHSTRLKNTRKKDQAKPVPVMTTEELQAVMMPTKKRRTARERTQTRATEFAIPADSDSPDHDTDDDSNFLPMGRGKRATRARETITNATLPKPGKSKAGKAIAGGKQKGTANPTAKLKSSTRTFIINTTTSAPVLSPSTSSRRNRETKSPSQLSSTAASTKRMTKAGISATESESAVASKKRYGGSLNARVGGDIADKENRSSSINSRRGGSDEDDVDNNSNHSGERKEDSQGHRAVAPRNKWADIDAWDMDFEEVEVMTPSGSSGSLPMRR